MSIGKFAISALTAAILFAGGSSMLSAQNSDADTAPPADAFSPIQRYAIAFDQPRDLAEFYLRDFGLKPYGADIEELPHPANPNMRVLLITLDPIKSGAVRGVQWRFDISANEGAWRSETAGIRRKCANGPNAGQWTRDVCS